MKPGDYVRVYFTAEHSAPYTMHGKFLGQDDDYFVIEGVVGDYIDKEYWIPKDGIKMIEVSKKGN